MKTGKIQWLDLRTVFPHEAHHFTPWLTAHLDELTPILGYDITDTEMEMQTENFRLDIIGRKQGTNKVVIIENQYGLSNHDHLGKVLSYTASQNADEAIWIVEQARSEHIGAITNLNKSQDKCRYWLIEARAIQIDNSAPAIIFNAVAQPEPDVSEYSDKLNAFWQVFLKHAKELNFKPYISAKPTHSCWINGKGYKGKAHLCMTAHKNKYIVKYIFEAPTKAENLQSYHAMYEHKAEIEQICGSELEWREMPNNLTCMVCKTIEGKGGYETDNPDELCTQMVVDAMRIYSGISQFECLLK